MRDTPEEISAPEVNAKRTRKERFTLLDCREPEELELASIAGATHIPMHDAPERLSELNPEDEIVVFCHHGRRSFNLASWLLSQGFRKTKSMRGGIDAWSILVDPSVPRY